MSLLGLFVQSGKVQTLFLSQSESTKRPLATLADTVILGQDEERKRPKLFARKCKKILFAQEFPFEKHYRSVMNRAWIKFKPRNARAARISSYIEHLGYKSSWELGTIIAMLLRSKAMTKKFYTSFYGDILQRDLNPHNE